MLAVGDAVLDVRLLVNLLRASRWVEWAAPVESGHPSNNASRARVLREVVLKYFPVPVSLLGDWSVLGPSDVSIGKLFVGYFMVGFRFETVDPRVANTIGELFFLAPQNIIRKEWFLSWIVGRIKSSVQTQALNHCKFIEHRQTTYFLKMYFSILSDLHILSSGSICMATSRNLRSRKGTLASRPQAMVDLFALRQSEVCRFLTRFTISSWNAVLFGAEWK